MFNRLNPQQAHVTLASIATNASALSLPIFNAARAGQVVGIRFIASTSQPAATTTASGLTITVYRNASNAASVVGTFNTSGTGVAAGSVASGVVATTVSKFAAGDSLLVEATGGAAMGSTLSAVVVVDYVYGYETN